MAHTCNKHMSIMCHKAARHTVCGVAFTTTDVLANNEYDSLILI